MIENGALRENVLFGIWKKSCRCARTVTPICRKELVDGGEWDKLYMRSSQLTKVAREVDFQKICSKLVRKVSGMLLIIRTHCYFHSRSSDFIERTTSRVEIKTVFPE